MARAYRGQSEDLAKRVKNLEAVERARDVGGAKQQILRHGRVDLEGAKGGGRGTPCLWRVEVGIGLKNMIDVGLRRGGVLLEVVRQPSFAQGFVDFGRISDPFIALRFGVACLPCFCFCVRLFSGCLSCVFSVVGVGCCWWWLVVGGW